MNKLQKYVKVTNLYWPKNEKNAQKYFEEIVKYFKSTIPYRLKNKKNAQNLKKCRY